MLVKHLYIAISSTTRWGSEPARDFLTAFVLSKYRLQVTSSMRVTLLQTSLSIRVPQLSPQRLQR